ncbi:Probable inactive glycosyltransferase 25 family member 3 (Cerebral endothelial cell adhesion molecule) [Durusdinium trenchii]|uniref:Probable inactive glycosyltransferase 25 family member 3 (Cerebral endothelial cell adhesion molecule) n=1 Tax=Durusdinium trenchii TaxID=1381693 RepID=A0ABP0QRP0_9DINO
MASTTWTWTFTRCGRLPLALLSFRVALLFVCRRPHLGLAPRTVHRRAAVTSGAWTSARTTSPPFAEHADASSWGRWSCFAHIYCINLDDRPERWRFMDQQFKELGMPAERWSAFDGRRLDFKALEELVYGGELSAEAVQRLFLPNQQKVFGMDLTPGAIGCALSHMQIWLDIMTRHGRGEFHGDERSQFLVVEDDCEFVSHFDEDQVQQRLEEVPQDWQLVFLGGVDAMGLQPLLQISPGVRRVYNGSRETTAYVINVEGAREALKVCFPLSWQLDTMLTMHSRLCDPPLWVSEDMQLSYTVKPMSYILWPPLALQNKRDFRTDVQKDEHPEFLRSNSYRVAPPVLPSPPSSRRDTELVTVEELRALERRYALVGSWDDWLTFHPFDLADGPILAAEVDVPPGAPVEFQVLRDNDWNQRFYPEADGSIRMGGSRDAHGKNWQQPVPLGPPKKLHVTWDPTNGGRLEHCLEEPSSVALARRYALAGSWDGWTTETVFVHSAEQLGTYVAAVEVPKGIDIEFQVVCPGGEFDERIFPAEDGEILGPSGDSFGRNWRLPAVAQPQTLWVYWSPVGKRRLSVFLDHIGAEPHLPGRSAPSPPAAPGAGYYDPATEQIMSYDGKEVLGYVNEVEEAWIKDHCRKGFEDLPSETQGSSPAPEEVEAVPEEQKAQ